MGFVAWEICGIIAIVIAVSKRQNACLWLIFGLWFGPIALLVSFFIPRKQQVSVEDHGRRCSHPDTYDDVHDSSDGYMKVVTRCRTCGQGVSRRRV
jgi:hypothetical protein